MQYGSAEPVTGGHHVAGGVKACLVNHLAIGGGGVMKAIGWRQSAGVASFSLSIIILAASWRPACMADNDGSWQ